MHCFSFLVKAREQTSLLVQISKVLKIVADRAPFLGLKIDSDQLSIADHHDILLEGQKLSTSKDRKSSLDHQTIQVADNLQVIIVDADESVFAERVERVESIRKPSKLFPILPQQQSFLLYFKDKFSLERDFLIVQQYLSLIIANHYISLRDQFTASPQSFISYCCIEGGQLRNVDHWCLRKEAHRLIQVLEQLFERTLVLRLVIRQQILYLFLASCLISLLQQPQKLIFVDLAQVLGLLPASAQPFEGGFRAFKGSQQFIAECVYPIFDAVCEGNHEIFLSSQVVFLGEQRLVRLEDEVDQLNRVLKQLISLAQKQNGVIHDAFEVAEILPFLHLLLRNTPLRSSQSICEAILALQLFLTIIFECLVMQQTPLTLQILANSLVKRTRGLPRTTASILIIIVALFLHMKLIHFLTVDKCDIQQQQEIILIQLEERLMLLLRDWWLTPIMRNELSWITLLPCDQEEGGINERAAGGIGWILGLLAEILETLPSRYLEASFFYIERGY